MLSIQEIVDKTKSQRKQIEETMDAWGHFHPDIETPEHTKASIYEGLSPADSYAIQETLKSIPLREFLAKSGTTGIAGAYYLVPQKVHDELLMYVQDTDKCPQLGYVVSDWRGGDLIVDIVNDATYVAKQFSSGGQIPTETVESVSATLSPLSFAIAPRITNDLIEDANFGMVEYHLEKAALAIGRYATSLALAVLNAPPDGWGTLNGGASGNSQETKWMAATTTGISECIQANLDDGFISNTIVTTGKAWAKSISETLPVGSTFLTVKDGFHHCVNNMDIILHTDAADIQTAATRHHTLVFDRKNAMLTGRKRWMQISNYADPVKDLAGATITCRQDSITLYKDAVARIIETA